MTPTANQVSVGHLIYGFTPKVDNHPITTFSKLISYLSGTPDSETRHGDADVFRSHPAIDAHGLEYFEGPMSFIQSGGKNNTYDNSYFIGVTESAIDTDGTTPILLDLKFKSLQGFQHRVTVDNYLSRHKLAVKTEDIDWHFMVSNKTSLAS
jgi:hypothetical protein